MCICIRLNTSIQTYACLHIHICMLYIITCVYIHLYTFIHMHICIGLHQPHDKGLCIGEKMEGDVNKNRKCLHLSEKKGLRNSWISRNSSDHVSTDISFNPVHIYEFIQYMYIRCISP
jgi:hypothetical protein